jgi:hypothetical protein
MDLKIKFNLEEEKLNHKTRNCEEDKFSLLRKTRFNKSVKRMYYTSLVVLLIVAYVYYIFWILFLVSLLLTIINLTKLSQY